MKITKDIQVEYDMKKQLIAYCDHVGDNKEVTLDRLEDCLNYGLRTHFLEYIIPKEKWEEYRYAKDMALRAFVKEKNKALVEALKD